MRRRRNVTTALVLTAGSAAAAFMIKRRQDRRRPYVGLYFEDGSMVSLPESAPQSGALIDLGNQALAAVRD